MCMTPRDAKRRHMVDPASVRVSADDVSTDRSYGLDEQLLPFVEWFPTEGWPLFTRRGWLVWRGEKRWGVTPEMVERAWAMYRIGVRVSAPSSALAALREHLPRMRLLEIGYEAEQLKGFNELRRARMLEVLEINPETGEEADLSRLWRLRRYRGPSHGSWQSVMALPQLERLDVDHVCGTVVGPVRDLALRSRTTSQLPELGQPAKLRELTVSPTRHFDLESLAPAVGLNVLTVTAAHLVGLKALVQIRTLTEVTIEGRTDEDIEVLADLPAAEAILILKQRPGPRLTAAIIDRGWSVFASDAQERAAYKAAGRVYPGDLPQHHAWSEEAGDVHWHFGPRHATATFVSTADDLPPGLSGIEAEQIIRERLHSRYSDEKITIEGTSTSDRLQLTFSLADVAIVSEAAAAVFAEHHRRN